jgi:D-alanyl-D-alanine dipeptidase
MEAITHRKKIKGDQTSEDDEGQEERERRELKEAMEDEGFDEYCKEMGYRW